MSRLAIFIPLLILVVVMAYFSEKKQIQDRVRNETVDTIENRLRVAVLDTGISYKQRYSDIMCKDIPFRSLNGSYLDKNGHGTNVVSIIAESLNTEKYCITMYKLDVEDLRFGNKYISLLQEVYFDKPYLVNLSIEGYRFFKEEASIVRELTKKGTTVVVSAGNGGVNLDYKCTVFPACLGIKIKKNFYVVGSRNRRYSNYGGVVTHVVNGDNIGNPTRSGTSQAAAYLSSNFLR